MLERIAYLLSLDGADQVAAGFLAAGTAGATSSERIAIARAKQSVANERVAVTEAQLAVQEAKAAGDAQLLAAAQTAAAEAAGRLALANARANVAIAQSKASGAAKEVEALGAKSTLAGSALQKMGFSASSAAAVTGAAVPVAAVAAGAALVKFGVDAVKAYEGATAAALDLERRSGSTAKQASELAAAGRVLGVSQDDLANGMARLAKNVTTNEQKFHDLGVAEARTAQGGVDVFQTFLNIADAMAKTDDQARKAQIGAAAFGRGYAALLPILNQGRDGLTQLFAEAARHHQVFSQDDLEKGRQLTLATNALKESFAGLEVEAGQKLVPALTLFFKGLEYGIEGIDQALGDVGKVVSFIGDVTGATEALSGVLGGGAGHQTDYAEAAKQAADAMRNEAEAADDAAKSFLAQRDAVIGVIDADKGLVDSKQAVADAQKAYDDAVKNEPARHDRDVADARQAVADATESEREAQKKLNDAIRDQPLNLAEAELAHAQAIQSVTDAQHALNEAVDVHGKNSDAAKEATLRLQEANLKVTQSAEAVEEVKSQKAIADARREVERAKLREVDAQDRLNTVLAQDPSDKVREAKKRLDDAEESLVKAVDGHKDAQDRLKQAFDNSTLSGEEFKRLLDGLLADFSAAGVDPKLIQMIRDIGDAAGNAGPKVDSAAAGLAQLRQLIAGTSPQPQPTSGTAAVTQLLAPPAVPVGPGHAAGGTVEAGTAYPVGEGGKPELFKGRDGGLYLIPGEGGTVVPGSVAPAGDAAASKVDALAAHVGAMAGEVGQLAKNVGTLTDMVDRRMRMPPITNHITGHTTEEALREWENRQNWELTRHGVY